MPKQFNSEDQNPKSELEIIKKVVNGKVELELAGAQKIAQNYEQLCKAAGIEVNKQEQKNAETLLQINQKAADERYKAECERIDATLARRIANEKLAEDEISKLEKEAEREKKAQLRKIHQERVAKEQQAYKIEELTQKKLSNLHAQAHKNAVLYRKQEYDKASVFRRAEMLAEDSAQIELHQKKLQNRKEEIDNTLDYLKAEKSAAEKNYKDQEKAYKAGKISQAELLAAEEQKILVQQKYKEESKSLQSEKKSIAKEEIASEEKLKDIKAEKSKMDETAKRARRAAMSDAERIVDLEKEAQEKFADAQAKKKETLEKLHSDKEILELQIAENPENEELKKALNNLTTKIEEVNNSDTFTYTDDEGNESNIDLKALEETLKNSQKESKKLSAKEQAKDLRTKQREDVQNQSDLRAAAREEMAANPKELIGDMGASIKESMAQSNQRLVNALNDLSKSIDNNVSTFFSYQASVDARLQGSDETYQDMINLVRKNLGMSPVVKMETVIENIKKMSDAGIAYNLDLRAFLASVSEDIAGTFDAANGTLLRLVRLQQADTTAARLGMEASLTKLFNSYFSDTSYLSDVADDVSSAIIEANSQLTKDQSIAFEYAVQKWLGALYSVGVSREAITRISEGINYIATGNVNALNSNDNLNTLMAMAASEANLPYSDLLVETLDADKTNKLLEAMVKYLKSIAESYDENKVTSASYADIFGLNISDLTAISNLDESTIQSLSSKSTSYNTAMDETSNQLMSLLTRVHMSEQIDNLMTNATAASSIAIGNNSFSYGLWKVLNLVEALTGGIPIPDVMVAGFGLALNTTVTELLKGGMAGLTLLGTLLDSLANGGVAGGLSVSDWGFEESVSSGGGLQFMSPSASNHNTSAQKTTGNTDVDSMKKTSLTDAREDAEEDEEVTGEHSDEDMQIYREIHDAVFEDASTTVLSELIKMNTEGVLVRFGPEVEGLLGPSRVFHTSLVNIAKDTDGMLTIDRNTGTTNYFDQYMGETALPFLLTSDHIKRQMNTEMSGLGGSSFSPPDLSNLSDTLKPTVGREDNGVNPLVDLILGEENYWKDLPGILSSETRGDSDAVLAVSDKMKNITKQLITEIPEYVDSLDTISYVLNGMILGYNSPEYLLKAESGNRLSQIYSSYDSDTNIKSAFNKITTLTEITSQKYADDISKLETTSDNYKLTEENTQVTKLSAAVTSALDNNKTALENALKYAVGNAYDGSKISTARTEAEANAALLEIFKQALQEAKLSVTIDNDYFDDFLFRTLSS